MSLPTAPPGFEIYRIVVRPKPGRDARAAGLLQDAQALGLQQVKALECQDLYFLEGQLSADHLEQIAIQLLSDPITQIAHWGRIITAPLQAQPLAPNPAGIIEVALRPGVTDPVAEQVVRASHQLDIPGLERASTGTRYLVYGENVDEASLHHLASRLLSNPVIQRYAIGEIAPVFPHPAESSGQVDVIPIRSLDATQLLMLSRQRRAALDLAEMQAIQAYYRGEEREPTDIEFEMIAQTWSEHCVHKTFKARIEVQSQDGTPIQVIDGLLKTYLRAATQQIAAPWVYSSFVDNAGIIEFDGEHEISFKVETHNHPSAIEPFGGANTGVGGVIRDVLGVSAKPIAASDVLCFGPQDLSLEQLPEGVLHPRRIQSGVVAGVQDYGNKIGIPTVNGAVLYDPGYTANPLVFCGCMGIAPRNSHPRQPKPGDRVIVLGGRTGRDGLRGATFSSMTMDAQTGEVAGASVQIGDPITEKGLIEVILRARDRKLYTAITDCGAGGLSSAVGEMSSTCGGQVDLKDVRLKYPGLAPWEIWLSEAQERMVLAVPETCLQALRDLCSLFEVELTDIGVFNETGRLVVQYAGEVVLDLENQFLHAGIPQRHLQAVIQPPRAGPVLIQAAGWEASQVLLRLLAHPDIRSKANIIHLYDHEVQGGTAVKPLVGLNADAPSDAVVLKPVGTRGSTGVVLSNGINPLYGSFDPYRMAWGVIDEAIRNAVAVGADPERIALLDNFCWGDPTRPETLGSLVEAARGCHDAAIYYGTPFISGKDSLNNEYLGTDGMRHAIPPTLLISAVGVIPDVSQSVTMDLKEAGNLVYLLGEILTETGGNHISLLDPPVVQAQSIPDDPGVSSPELAGSGAVPSVPLFARDLYRALYQAAQAGLLRACHDLSEGGLGVAAAEMCIGGRLGIDLHLDMDSELSVFTQANASLLVEVRPQDQLAFERCFAQISHPRSSAHASPLLQRVGRVTADPVLRITNRGTSWISLPVESLAEAWGAQ